MRKVFSKFSPRDFQFLADLVGEDKDKTYFIDLVTRDPDSLDLVLEEEEIFKKVIQSEDVFVRISPYLYFELLLRQAIRDIKRDAYTLEQVGYKTRVPVFDSQKVLEVLSQDEIRDYLVELLVSFIRVNQFTIYLNRGRGIYFKKVLSDMDFDLLVEMSEIVDEPYRFVFLKRAGDLALFLSGIFPEQLFGERSHSLAKNRRLLSWTNKGEDLEKKGSELYHKASESEIAKERELSPVLTMMADNFTFTKKPLNVMADRYLYLRKHDIFPFIDNQN